MKNGFTKRLISLMVSLCMILTFIPVSVLAGNEGDPQTITAGALVAGAYGDLSQAEKDLIDSGFLAADTAYKYYVPDEGDDLIQVDTEGRTVAAESWTDDFDNVWAPVQADIIVNGQVRDTVTPDGTDVFEDVGNAFSVKVAYEMYICVDSAVQEQLLNTAGWLKDGVANLDTIAAQSTNMGVVELAMPQLVELRNMEVSVGSATFGLSAEGKAAIDAMNAQTAANDGKLTLNAMVTEYYAGAKAEYLLNSGSQMKPELEELTGHVGQLAAALDTLNGSAATLVQFGLIDAATGEMIDILADKVNALLTGLNSASAGDWTAAEKGTALVVDGVDYAALDTLVAALSDVASVDTLSDRILAAETSIQFNLSMKNVTVQVELLVVEEALESDTLVSGGATHSVVLTLAENATKAEIEAALAETTVEAEAIASWDAYVAGQFESSATQLPDTLTEDIVYTITYSPVTYTITYDYEEGTTTKDVPYGYIALLETYSGSENKVYDYYVDGSYFAQGSVYNVDGDVTITRETGKPYTSTDLYTAIAGMEGVTDKEKAILTAGALQGNSVLINVRYPDTDAGNLVSIDSDLVLTGATYPSDYAGLVWAPYSYIVTAGDGTDAEPAAFTRNGDVYTAQITDTTFQSIKVYYRLSLVNLEADAAQIALDLVEKLVTDAESQNSALAALSSDSVANNLDMLDAIILDTLEGLVTRNDLHSDAGKNALLKECFTDVIAKIKENCLDVTGAPRIAALIEAYINSGKSLTYYYRNSEQFISEVSLLSQFLDEMLAADENLTAEEKLDAMKVLIGAAPDSLIPADKVDEYSQKLPELQTKMNEIKTALAPADAAINLTSANLNKLVNALQQDGTVGTDCSDYVYLQSQSFDLAGSGKIVLKVNVIYGEVEKSVSETVDQNAPVQQTAVDALKAKVAALLTEMDIDDPFWHDSEEYAGGNALDDLVGRSFATNETRSYTWVKLERTPCEISGHTEQIIPGKDPTCTATGLTEGKICSICGEVLEAQQEIPAAGHTAQIIPGKDPTCTATGLTEGEKCSVCNEILIAQETIPALGHDYTGEWKSDETGHWHECTRGCGAIDAVTAHSYDTNDCAQEAQCTVCSYTKEAGKHTWGPLEKVDDETHKQVCSSCHAEQENPHSWTLADEKAATCTVDGHKKYSCSCGAEKTDVLTMLGHSWSAWTKVDEEKHSRVCAHDAAHVETEDHNWDEGVENADGDMVYTCTDECGATKLVVLNKEEKLEAGSTIKAPLVPDQDGGVTLAKPEDNGFEGSGYRYDYVINGVTYKVTNDTEIESIYPGSVSGATMTLVNIDNEKLENLLDKMSGAQPEKDSTLKPTNDGYYTGIKVETDINGMMGVVMTLVQNTQYGYVALGDEPLLSDSKISLLGLLRMLMGSDGKYTSQDLIDLSNGENKILIDTNMVLKQSAPTRTFALRASAANDGHDIDFQILLTATPAELGSLGAALEAVQNYITFDIKAAEENDVLISNRLDIDVKVELPAKVYEIYVAALRLTGNVDVNDANAVKEAVIYNFLKDYVDVLLGADVTTTTLMNTAAKLGQTVDLTEFEGIFNALKGKLDYGQKITYSADGLSAALEFTDEEMEQVVDQLEPMVGDPELMVILKTMLVECQPGATVEINLNAFATNFTDDDNDSFIDTEYEAIIIDAAAVNKPGLEKADVFDITEDLAASVAALEGYAAIMLQKDVAGDLHFSNAAILDLNGHTITGSVTADAKLIIIDSTLATATVGGITGTITGSDVTVLAGTYSALNSSFLKDGYTQNSAGTIVNEYYVITKSGNDITFALNADVLATRELPGIWLAADFAADLAMNYFTTSALAFDNDTDYSDAYEIYVVQLENLLTLITDETTGEEKVNQLLDILKIAGATGIEGFVNDLLEKAMDFSTLAAAVSGGTDLMKYSMVTAPWTVDLAYVYGEDYLTVGIEPGEIVEGSIAVTVSGADENKQRLADMLSTLGEIMDPAENSVTIAVKDPAYAGGALTISGSVDAAISIDMSGNDDYAALVGMALAYSNINKDAFVAALNTYFTSGETADLHNAFETVTMANYVSALKAVNGKTVDQLAAAIAVSADIDSAISDLYRAVVAASNYLLTKLDITGGSAAVLADGGCSAEGTYGKTLSTTLGGITVTATLESGKVAAAIKLFEKAEEQPDDPPYIPDDPPYIPGDSYSIEVLNANNSVILSTDSFSEAAKAAKEGYTIKIHGQVSMTEHAYINCAVTIIGAKYLTDTGYVVYLADAAAAKLVSDAELNIGSSVDGYKAVCAKAETFTYTLEKISVPAIDGPVAGRKVATVNDQLYLLLDLDNDGMTLNALRESIQYSDLTGTIKFEIEGNDGTALIKTTDRMKVSTYNADNNCVATITYAVVVMGDTNCNGKVNTSDATVMKNINFGQEYSHEVLIAADVNLSGSFENPKINSSDATYIMSKWFTWDSGKYKTNLE